MQPGDVFAVQQTISVAVASVFDEITTDGRLRARLVRGAVFEAARTLVRLDGGLSRVLPVRLRNEVRSAKSGPSQIGTRLHLAPGAGLTDATKAQVVHVSKRRLTLTESDPAC